MGNLVLYKDSLKLILVITLLLGGCVGKKDRPKVTQSPEIVVNTPDFNRDSAYFFIERQVNFGPRIPNTEAHRKAGDYIIGVCKRYGATVLAQEFSTPAYDGQQLFLRNIIASYAPQKRKRILLAAHWDTRPFADRDTKKPRATFDGANDGASGVGVLLEIARLLGHNDLPAVGVDIIFFDGEDWGVPVDEPLPTSPPKWDSWWCLGSQYWSKNKHKSNYSAYYGILLDMVGAKNSQFFREGVSLEYAPRIVSKVWGAATRLGYSSYFVKQNAGAITDDHVYVNKWAKIPMVNIVHYKSGVGYFGEYHHSQKDNMTIISRETLEAVGRTVIHVLYHEKG